MCPTMIWAAGWTANWPSYDYPGQGYQHRADCYTALTERASAANLTLDPYYAPGTWTQQRPALTNYKVKLAMMIPAYVNTNYSEEGNYTNWFASGNTNPPVWTKATLLATAYLPTNYFEYTPWSCLSGLGMNGTNDDNYGGIGHPFGPTNEYTVLGGTNWTPGRTNCWYITDYGWQGLKDMLGYLTTTWTNTSWSGTTGDSAGGYYNSRRSWEEATNQAIAAYTTGAFAGAPLALTQAQQTSAARWWAWVYGYQAMPYLSCSTMWQHSGGFYLRGKPSTTWDTYGRSITTNYALVESFGPTMSGAIYGSYVGSTNGPWLSGPWATLPPVGNPAEGRGHYVEGWTIVDWEFDYE
jgi:hypothetical protein